MRLRLISVGRPREARLRALHDDYASRLEKLGVAYESRWVEEVRSAGRYADDHVRERETKALLEAAGDEGARIALDRGGEALSSEAFARRLERWAARRATFLVGGPLGLDRKAVARADFVWSLSPLTFPHELVRALVAEQLYRAVTILRGIPYHR